MSVWGPETGLTLASSHSSTCGARPAAAPTAVSPPERDVTNMLSLLSPPHVAEARDWSGPPLGNVKDNLIEEAEHLWALDTSPDTCLVCDASLAMCTCAGFPPGSPCVGGCPPAPLPAAQGPAQTFEVTKEATADSGSYLGPAE